MKNILMPVAAKVAAKVAAILILASCGRGEKVRIQIKGAALGTYYSIAVMSRTQDDIQPEVDSLLRTLDASMSIFNPRSLLSRINRNETDSLDSYLAECISTALEVSRQSGGSYDVTVKPLVEAYGFAGGDTVQNPDIDSILQFVGYEKISIESATRLRKSDPRVEIDLNSIAKGFIVDKVGEYLIDLGYADVMVEIGGEVFARGGKENGKPWSIGVDVPYEGNFSPGADMAGIVSLRDRCMATSGNYRRYYTDSAGRKVVHTVNPLTGLPEINDILQATVVAVNTKLADAYATTFMSMGFESSRALLASHPELDAFLIYDDGRGGMGTYATEGMKLIMTE